MNRNSTDGLERFSLTSSYVSLYSEYVPRALQTGHNGKKHDLHIRRKLCVRTSESLVKDQRVWVQTTCQMPTSRPNRNPVARGPFLVTMTVRGAAVNGLWLASMISRISKK